PTFNITTSLVQTATTVTITASLNGVQKTDTLVVNPLIISSMSLSPNSVVSGLSSTSNRVTLNAAAPTGGAVVALSSDNPAVVVPSSVTVAAGATVSNAFTITTTGVPSTVQATVTASYNGNTKTGTFTVTPPTLSTLNVVSSSVIGPAAANGNY